MFTGGMTKLWRKASAALTGAMVLCALPGTAAQDDLTTTAIKRYFLAEANARCHLLDGPAAMAVTAGYVQARNTLIRSTGSLSGLTPYLAQARDAAQRVDCQAPQLISEVNTAASAYRAFASQPRLALPGVRTEWLAMRSHPTETTWRLAQYQSSGEADLALGLYGTLEDNRFAVMARFADGRTPYSARLIVRDTEVALSGIINQSPQGLSDNIPVGFASGTRTFLASDSATLTANLRPEVKTNLIGYTVTGEYAGAQGPVEALRFDFPTRAWRAIAPLDPREDIVIAFDFRDGTRYARFEVGDFITGLAYVRLPSVYGNGFQKAL